VADVRHPLDVAPADGERREQDPGEGKAARSRAAIPVSMAVRRPAPRPSLKAWSTAGLARSPRQATITSPTVARTATPDAAQPPGESTWTWLNASNVEARSQWKATNGSSLSR
jgi:hypothetical protein